MIRASSVSCDLILLGSRPRTLDQVQALNMSDWVIAITLTHIGIVCLEMILRARGS